MKLDTYIRSKNLTDEKFAVLIGVDRSAVTRWRNGTVCPEPENQRKIFEVTRGKVTPNDFLIPAGPRPFPGAKTVVAGSAA